jgi:hypothetical protein
MSAELTTPLGGRAVDNGDAVAYGLVVSGLAEAGTRLAGLADRVRGTYRYIERCAAGVEQLADHMQGLAVDLDTVSEHREAAILMRAVLASAEHMAAGVEDLSALFSGAAATHEADYGSVADAAKTMTVPMAEATFYGNR